MWALLSRGAEDTWGCLDPGDRGGARGQSGPAAGDGEVAGPSPAREEEVPFPSLLTSKFNMKDGQEQPASPVLRRASQGRAAEGRGLRRPQGSMSQRSQLSVCHWAEHGRPRKSRLEVGEGRRGRGSEVLSPGPRVEGAMGVPRTSSRG